LAELGLLQYVGILGS